MKLQEIVNLYWCLKAQIANTREAYLETAYNIKHSGEFKGIIDKGRNYLKRKTAGFRK